MPSPNDKRLREFDWAQSPLGERGGWPPEMNTVLGLMMASDFPMGSVWGDQRIQIYNAAYNPIYGAKHPGSFGAPMRESWQEIRDFLEPAIDQVVTTGGALWFAETLLPLVRSTVPEECYFDFSYSPIRSADGMVLGVLSVATERTSEVVMRRRQRLEELDSSRRAEDTFAALMQTLHDVLAPNEMDCAKGVLYSVASDTGAPDGEIWALRASQDFIRAMRPLAARALRSRSIIMVDTGAGDGDIALTHCIPIYSLDGDPCCSLVISPSELVPLETSVLPFLEAISTRVHAALHAAELRKREIGKMREQIAEQEQLYKFLFNNIQDGVAYCATSGSPLDDEIILAVNSRLCDLLGYTADELIGMSRDTLFSPGDEALKAALEERYREYRFTGELQFCRKDGQTVPLDVSSNLIEFGERQLRSLSLIRDTSHRREAEKQQAEQVRLETVANLAGSLAHDTNNLMTVVIGSAEYLSEWLPSGGKERQMALNARIAAERAAGLTTQLLIYAGQQPLVARPVDLNAFLAEIRALLVSALGGSNRLTVSYEADLPPCMADTGQLTTAILNLVTNARHAMPQGGTLMIETFRPATAASTTDNRGGKHTRQFVGLRVTDSGTGIPQEIQDRVFEPFFTTKELGSGSGLGLSIVRRLMDELGGTLRMFSTPGKGTMFELCFQMAGSANAEDGRHATDARAQGELVLYVEDNEAVRHQTERTLRQIGVDLIAFETGRGALEWVRAGGHADLLFTDLVLPGGMSGLDLAIAVRRLQPDLPVVITTGYDPRGVLADERHRHFSVLRKPYTRSALATALLGELQRS